MTDNLHNVEGMVLTAPTHTLDSHRGNGAALETRMEQTENAATTFEVVAPEHGDGTHLQGEIVTTYRRLCLVFGSPKDGDGIKTDAEWTIRLADGRIATIYNWKNGKAYLGEDGTPTHMIGNWHIGGTEPSVVADITRLLAVEPAIVRVTLPTTRVVYGTTTYEVIVNGETLDRLLAQFNEDPEAFCNRHGVESGDIIEEFDNKSETEITDGDYSNAEIRII